MKLLSVQQVCILNGFHTRTFFTHLVYYLFHSWPTPSIAVNSSFHAPVHCDIQTPFCHVCMELMHLGQLVLAGPYDLWS